MPADNNGHMMKKYAIFPNYSFIYGYFNDYLGTE